MQVSDFNLVVHGDDLAHNNLYSIEIGMPNGQGGEKNYFGGFYNEHDEAHLQKSLSYMAKNVTVPGKSIGTIDAKRFGPIYKVANDLIIDTISMTFMLSEDWREHKFFDGWISGIMGYVKPGTGASTKNTGGNRQLYTLSYYSDYISTVNIIPLDRQGGRVPTIQLRNAYPTNLGPVELAWGDAGEIATFNVTWSFQDWNHVELDGWWADTSDLPGGADGAALAADSDKFTRKDHKLRQIEAKIRQAKLDAMAGLNRARAQMNAE